MSQKISVKKFSGSTKGLELRPFRAWHYNTKQVLLDQVIAPPYDVISKEEQEALYNRSPFNVVRLILGKEANFHDHAAGLWKEWSRQNILIQDSKPAIYLYKQVFQDPVTKVSRKRLALLGILNLDHSDQVLRHETTFEGPKRDRLSLLEKTRTNLSPIFGLYSDAARSLSTLLKATQKNSPLSEAKGSDGTLHKTWAIEKVEDQSAIQAAIGGQKILIADGHHRFETALEYRRRMREKFPDRGNEAPYDFTLMALVEFEDPGLLVLPTHRVIRSFGSSSKERFLERLRVSFEFVPVPEESIFSLLEKRPESEKVFGLILRDGCFHLRLRNLQSVRKELPPGKPPIWYEGEAILLNAFVFDRLWGIPESERPNLLSYTHSFEEALQAVRGGQAEGAFLLRSPNVTIIHQLAEAGEKMPQKTTYFYPKLASGLFFYHHG